MRGLLIDYGEVRIDLLSQAAARISGIDVRRVWTLLCAAVTFVDVLLGCPLADRYRVEHALGGRSESRLLTEQ